MYFQGLCLSFQGYSFVGFDFTTVWHLPNRAKTIPLSQQSHLRNVPTNPKQSAFKGSVFGFSQKAKDTALNHTQYHAA